MKPQEKTHIETCFRLRDYFYSKGASVRYSTLIEEGIGEVDLLVSNYSTKPMVIEVKSFPSSPRQKKVMRQLDIYRNHFPNSQYYLAFPQGKDIALVDLDSLEKFVLNA